MKSRIILIAALLVTSSGLAAAETIQKPKAEPMSAGKTTTAQAKMDPQAMADMMAKMAAPGPQHEMLQKLAGNWTTTVKFTYDPAQPWQESKGTSVVTTLMDGRYSQEQSSGTMQGKPFSGMGLTGYDNVLKKYVSTWIDNMGTGIMTSQGTPDASGKVVNWTGSMADPATGKMSPYRMVTRTVDDDHHVMEMYMKGQGGKEFKTMEITYERSK